MAKQATTKTGRTIPQATNQGEVQIAPALSKAGPPQNPPIYVNHALFTMTTHEVIIDLYKLSPVPNSNPPKAEAEYVQRIYLPHSLAKGFVTGLANVIGSYEKDNNQQIINNRNPSEDDNVVIWK